MDNNSLSPAPTAGPDNSRWQRLIDRGTVVEGILVLDADSLHPWVFRGIEGYAAPAPMPEWAEPHLQCDEFEQLVASEQTAAELARVADLNALDEVLHQERGKRE